LLKRFHLSRRQLIVWSMDSVLAGLSLAVAFLLRFDLAEMTPERVQAVEQGVPILMAIAAVVLPAFGLHRDVWRYSSLRSLLSILKAAALAILLFQLATWLVDRGESIPRSVPVIQWFALVFLLAGPRFAARLASGPGRPPERRRDRAIPAGARVPVLVVGMDHLAELFVRSTEHDPAAAYRAVGVLDLASGERGRRLHQVPVFGGLAELPKVIGELSRRNLRPARLVVTRPFDGETMRTLLGVAERFQLTICRLPRLTDFQQPGEGGRVEPRPVALEELLGRPEARLDQAAIGSLLADRRVLVTGAGGSIGSELARQVARRGPARLVLLDSGEFNLYSIDQQLGADSPAVPRRAVLADVRDRRAVARLFEEERPELVFHAAALKHVPLVEANPCEGVRTNVLGTRNVADAACRAGAVAFVQVSTDKAVNPTSVMGASKRLAELYVQALDVAAGDDSASDRPVAVGAPRAATRLLTVRFGNVLGSSGSVIPLFERQLARGGPITITHPEIRRYFMTIREAVELVLQASAHGVQRADERGQIFVLDMGEPVRIVDLARQMIRLAGLEPGRDIKIDFVGLRPGEKLFEELFDAGERRLRAAVPGMAWAVSRPLPLASLREAFDRLAAAAGDGLAVECLLAALLPNYRRPVADPGSRTAA
jgi:O-antigen biosynthesis protein WbqV